MTCRRRGKSGSAPCTHRGIKECTLGEGSRHMEIERQSEVAGKANKSVSAALPRNVVSEKAGDDMEVAQHRANGKETVAQPAARRPPQQVNAFASSSRVQLPATSPSWVPSPAPRINHNQTPHQSPQHSSQRHPPLQSNSRNQRSPSPLDWGSPTGEGMGNASSPINAHTMRTPATSPSKTQPVPLRMPSPPPPDNVLRNSRRSPSRHDAGSSPEDDPSRVLPRLSFTNLGALRNRDRSIGSVEQSSLTRRSRAPSPRTDKHPHPAQYQLASPAPPRTKSPLSRPNSGTPLEKKTNRRAQDALPFGFKRSTATAQQHPAAVDEARRHSFPAALPRVDFNTLQDPPRPRQSLPPRATLTSSARSSPAPPVALLDKHASACNYSTNVDRCVPCAAVHLWRRQQPVRAVRSAGDDGDGEESRV
ncbi:hypothetical protein B0H12DRAFT_376256 [Mycena haematopus]|nr:hypothetical protein B0H12DRAFT_376256 [Mycena haematopus]